MEITSVAIHKPEDVNLILGQSHFIKTVEDLHEALVGAVPGIKFGSPSARPPDRRWSAGAALTTSSRTWPAAPC